MILLPVVALAIVSLISLRQDERVAEQDARSRAAENTETLSRAVRSSVNDELHRFVELENDWLSFPEYPAVGRGVVRDTKLNADMGNWAKDYPELNLADVAAGPCEILPDGRQVRPPPQPAFPTPPKWFLDLSPQQKDLWRDLRAATNSAKTKPRQDAFLASFGGSPPAEAQMAARDLTDPSDLIPSDGEALATETGVSFQDVACFRLLSVANARLSPMLLKRVWDSVIQVHSFVAPKLLELARGLTNSADIEVRRKFTAMQIFRNEQSRAERWLEPIQRMPELQPWKSIFLCTWSRNDEALAFVAPLESVSSGFSRGRGYQVSFVARPVIEAIFMRALATNGFLVPDYARTAVSIEGRRLQSNGSSSASSGEDVMGSAEQAAGDDLLTQDALHFDLKLLLTSRERMLSTGRRRERLFAGLILGTVLTAITGLVAARRAFYRQLQLNEMKSNFVSSVSHELRAPIASVRLMAENLEGDKIPEAPRQREYFHFIVQECRRLSALIENVLDFSRIEQGRKQYNFEAADVTSLAQTTVKLMEPRAAEKGVGLELVGAFGAVELEIDGRAIQQALVNLIDNAIKHSPKGEVVRVTIETNDGSSCSPGGARLQPTRVETGEMARREPRPTETSAEDILRLSVSDYGPGIPPEEHERIFERFYRLGSELRRETEGVGIGLSLVKHIVTAHGGRIVLQSEPGKGSTFTIVLPMRNRNE